MPNLTQHAAETGSATLQTKVMVGTGFGGFVVAGLTLYQVVGIAAGVISIITMIAAYFANRKRIKSDITRNEAETALFKAQLEKLQNK